MGKIHTAFKFIFKTLKKKDRKPHYGKVSTACKYVQAWKHSWFILKTGEDIFSESYERSNNDKKVNHKAVKAISD